MILLKVLSGVCCPIMGNQLVSYIENLKMRIMIDCKLLYFIACCGSFELNWMINVYGGADCEEVIGLISLNWMWSNGWRILFI